MGDEWLNTVCHRFCFKLLAAKASNLNISSGCISTSDVEFRLSDSHTFLNCEHNCANGAPFAHPDWFI